MDFEIEIEIEMLKSFNFWEHTIAFSSSLFPIFEIINLQKFSCVVEHIGVNVLKTESKW